MFTPFRDGLQSSFGGKARLQDFLPAMEASAKAGIRHLEFGGGARFQAPMFYLGEDPFETMDKIRSAVGPDCDLQILTRSVSGVTLTTQSIEALELQGLLCIGTRVRPANEDGHIGVPVLDQERSFVDAIRLLGQAAESDDMYAAIDALADKLDRQLIKHKEKHRGR